MIRVNRTRRFNPGRPRIKAKEGIEPKDIISIVFSASALTLSVMSAWYTFFRNESHLKMAISSGHAKLEDVPTGGHFLSSFFDISFLNDGNKETLLRDISLSLAKLDKSSSQKIAAFESKYADRRTTFRNDPQKLAATEVEWNQELPTVMPACPESGNFMWSKYQHAGKDQAQGPVVVKEGEFFITGKLEFFPAPFEGYLVKDDEKTTDVLQCVTVRFIKANGSVGARTVPASLLRMVQRPENGWRITTVYTVEGLRSLDR
jgi:hypothetical protein